MTWQSAWEQAKSVRLQRHTVIGLAAGILVGLMLGLLIGWVWWPVEWQGTEPVAAPAAATGVGTALGSQFETPEAKALYLGAVADAFVYASAAGDADAAAIAAQRLAALGGDMRAAFNNAIDFYGAQAGGATRVNNLTTLAMAVGIPLNSGAPTAPAAVAGAAAPSAGVTGEQAAASATGSTTTTTGSPNWLPTLLVALLLMGGGVYILMYLQRRQAAAESAESGGAFTKEPAPADEPSAVTFARDELNPPRANYTPAASVRSMGGRPQAAHAGGFDSEDLNEYDEADDENGDEAQYAAEDLRNAHLRYAAADRDDEDGDDWGDEEEEEAGAEPLERRGPLPSGFVTSVGATPPFSGATASGLSIASTPAPANQAPANQAPASQAPASQAPAAQAAPTRPSPSTLQPPTPSRYEHFTPVESYTATYHVGRVDFDYTKNIPNTSGDGYDGEYGIGIHEKLGLLNNDLEKVIAIDVYLFDKTDDKQPITISRSLLSLFADQRRAEFERANDREYKTLPPIVAQPNTNFQLEGRQLLLDSLIKQVDYTQEGYFRSVTVELVLKRKG